MKRRTPDHPKVVALEERLKIPRYAAVGVLELLWHYTSEFAPNGGVGKYSNAAIARACHWKKDSESFVLALIETGWLDRDKEYRLLVHDWADHVDDTTKKRLQRAKVEIIVRPPNGDRAVTGRNPEDTPPPPNGGLARGCGREEAEAEAKARQDAVPARFAEFWKRWCELTKRKQRQTYACQAWLSVVVPDTEFAVMACLERYGKSGDVARSAIANPDKWIYDQAKDGWNGEWPPPVNEGIDKLHAKRQETLAMAKYFGGQK